MARCSDYRFLFPYEKVPKGTRILIYGAGEMGLDYLSQMQITDYCKVIAMIDKNAEKISTMPIPIYTPDQVRNLEFDLIVVAKRVEVGYSEIERVLQAQGVSKERIICIFERDTEGKLSETGVGHSSVQSVAENPEGLSIAFLLAGGIGDHVIQKRFLTEIACMLPECRIDIFSVRHTEFLEFLYSDFQNVGHVFSDTGGLYRSRQDVYPLAITLEACHYAVIDHFEQDIFEKDHPDFAIAIKKMELAIRREKMSYSVPVHVPDMRRLYRGQNAYTGMGYDGAFSITDKRVTIPFSEAGEAYYQSLGVERYVTINYGNGECADGSKIAKTWPLKRFDEVAGRIKKAYPDLSVIQLGGADAPRMDNVDIHILGEKLECVSHILRHSLFHIDIEGGLVHIASQLGTKCFVLFGPTVEAYYGYENNIHIRAGECKDCFGLYADPHNCVRNMEKPECMYSITADIVMEKVNAYMRGEL